MQLEQLQQILVALGGAAGLGALLMPPLVAAIVRVRWPSPVKALVALASSAGVGAITAWAAGDLTGLALPAVIGVVMASSQIAYRRWWHRTGIAQWIETHIFPGRTTIDGEVTAAETIPIDEPGTASTTG